MWPSENILTLTLIPISIFLFLQFYDKKEIEKVFFCEIGGLKEFKSSFKTKESLYSKCKNYINRSSFIEVCRWKLSYMHIHSCYIIHICIDFKSALCKGQIISKANCQALNSSKKRTNELFFTTMRCVFVRFLEEIEDTKETFRNYLTFSSM